MVKINENYANLRGSYLFSEIAKRVNAFMEKNPKADIIKLGIGDVTRPLPPAVAAAMHRAVDEMSKSDTFRGYGPEQGYGFLREKIAAYDYRRLGADITADEIFVSDGAKCDCGNIQEIFGTDMKVAVQDPVYTVYLDTNIMAGRSGEYDPDSERYKNIIYLPATAENGFVPKLPEEKVDVIYLCYPNNPTGTVLNRNELKRWVDYAKENDAVILFDAAYEAFITQDGIPHTIYEIEGAKDVAIEFRSFSKTAGFTGTRCAYTVVPKTLNGYDDRGNPYSLHALWSRRQSTKFNGVSYVTQRAAEACYSEAGIREIKASIDYYLSNARTIRTALEALGIRCAGGVDSPYVWLKTPGEMASWDFFDKLLTEINVVGTPGAGFGNAGEGYFRLTGFGSKEKTRQAVERFNQLSV